MMAAAAAGFATACVALAPSAPARHEDEHGPLRPGVFGPEEYGIVSLDPANQPAMLDLDAEERAVALASLGLALARLARDERKRGVVLHQLRCPILIVTGELEPDRQPTHYEDLDLAAEYLSVARSSHWGLVLSRRARALERAGRVALDGTRRQCLMAGWSTHVQRAGPRHAGRGFWRPRSNAVTVP
jgi:hypothetical protein